MRRLLALLLLASLPLTGCGGVVHISGALNPSGGVIVASGLVTIVHLTFTSDGNGTSVQVTAVTLVQPGTAQTLTFCGSQVNQFPVNSSVKASFTPGTACATLISVVIN